MPFSSLPPSFPLLLLLAGDCTKDLTVQGVNVPLNKAVTVAGFDVGSTSVVSFDETVTVSNLPAEAGVTVEVYGYTNVYFRSAITSTVATQRLTSFFVLILILSLVLPPPCPKPLQMPKRRRKLPCRRFLGRISSASDLTIQCL